MRIVNKAIEMSQQALIDRISTESAALGWLLLPRRGVLGQLRYHCQIQTRFSSKSFFGLQDFL